MHKKLRSNNPGLRFLVDFWSRHCTLEPWHEEWTRQHVHVPPSLHRDTPLYFEGEAQKNVYLVAKGLLARVQIDLQGDKRHILSVALPGMAFMTTDHLYSDRPSQGDIVSLRPHTLIIEIPYRAIRDLREREPNIETLIQVLTNKNNKQLGKLRIVTHGTKPFESYLRFTEELPELHRVLTNQECADLLGISIDTVRRAKKKWAKL